jgi:hypothetical protein
MDVPGCISEASLIRHAQRAMNVGPLVQEVYDLEQRGLDRHAIRLHRFSRNHVYGGRELVFYSVVQLAKKQ